MKTHQLIRTAHGVNIGDFCGKFEPNILNDTMLMDGEERVGFYIRDLSKFSQLAAKLAVVANAELLSSRVPKSTMKRSQGNVLQYSTIIGSVPPKAHMRRPYPTISSVHNVDSASTFIKSMLALCRESEEIVRNLLPGIFEKQCKIIEENVPPKWRFGRMFTSSISNFNISAPFHRDAGNLEHCVNIIITKKYHSLGGNLHVPDYGATFDSRDSSMIVYPAWRNVHGVTPIETIETSGYRNSLIFYPLKAFSKL